MPNAEISLFETDLNLLIRKKQNQNQSKIGEENKWEPIEMWNEGNVFSNWLL